MKFICYKGVFKTLPNIYDGNVCKTSYWLIVINHSRKKALIKKCKKVNDQ